MKSLMYFILFGVFFIPHILWGGDNAKDDSYTTSYQTAVSGNVLDNDSGNDKEVISNTTPSHGTLSGVNKNGNFTYTPDNNYLGKTDSFSYTMQWCATSAPIGGACLVTKKENATVTINITGVPNVAPEANDDSANTKEDNAVTIDVLENDTDDNGDTLTIQATSNGPSNGSVTINADNTITYTPDSGFSGSDSFDYTISDGNGEEDTATVSITVSHIINVTSAPVCIESLSYGKKEGKITGCFNAEGIFQGGEGCLQKLKLRNLSDKNITASNLVVDYSNFSGTLDNTCGIDGVDETDHDCNITSSPDNANYDPFRAFSEYKTRSIYLGITNANNGSSPFDGNISIEYQIENEWYSAPVEKCQIESTESEDLCYDEKKTDGLICFDMGEFFSGGIGCKTTIYLRNQGDSTLYSPSVDMITNSMFSGHMIDDCGLDEKSGNCSDSDVMDMGFMGMSGMGMARGISYDPMPDFDSNETHTTYTKSLLDAKVFSKTTLLGTYVKDGKLYHGAIKKCDGGIIVYFEKDHYDVREDINVIGTTEVVHPVIKLNKTSNEDVIVHYKTLDGTATVADGDYVNIDDETITIPAGENNVTINVQVYNDEPIELDEYFFVQLFNPTGASLDDRNRTRINILAQEDSPICFEDDFDNGLDSKWRVLENPNAGNSYTPQVVTVNGDSRFRLTDQSHNLATVVTKDYEFTTSQNLIIVEFDYYAYGGCSGGNQGLGTYGADGIVNVLFDSSIGPEPIPGARGGSLGYAQMTATNPDQNGFQGGWLGLGIDEFGNYSNPNEGRVGGPGFRRNAVAIRGDGAGISGYEYLDGNASLNPPVAAKLSDNLSDYYSGRYRFTVDARDPDHLYIRLERSMDYGKTWDVIISQFDAKGTGYNQGVTPKLVRYALTAGTGGGCNNHEIGWIRLKGNCAPYGHISYTTGPFDAWDTFRNVNDRNISTKLSGSNFDLVLASLDETHTKTELKNNASRVYYGLVKRNGTDDNYRYVLDPLDKPALNFTTNKAYTKDFKVDKAIDDTKVVFRFCADYNGTAYTLYPPDENCTGQPSIVLHPDEQNIVGWREILSGDNFALRPDHFVIDSNDSILTSGNDFTLTIHAVDKSGNDVVDYNESLQLSGSSPVLEHEEEKSNCITGTLNKSSGNFRDGKAVVTLNYDEIGKLKLLLTEYNSSDYAHVDLDDTDYNSTTNDSPNHQGAIYRQIKSADTSYGFNLDHFELIDINLSDYHNAPDSNFTYLARVPFANTIDPNMASKLEFTINAKTQQDNIARNYNYKCYANPLDLKIEYLINDAIASDINPGKLENILYKWYDDNSTKNEYSSSQALGSSLNINTITKNIFNTDHNGTAKLTVKLNFDRTYNEPVNPFKLNIKDITVEDSTHPAITDPNTNDSADHNATFLYARAKSTKYIYKTTANSITTPIMVQVYCDKFPASAANCPSIDIAKNAQTDEYQWWMSMSHNMTTGDGNITLKTTEGIVAPISVSINDANNGIDNNISVTKQDANIVNINFDTANPTDTSTWLIYNKDANNAPNPFYKVEFMGIMDWAGYGKTGNVVDGNISKHKNQRLGW